MLPSTFDTKEILNSLGVTQKELREICVISGTDYNYNNDNNNDNNKDNDDNPSLYKTLSYFKKYHKEKPEIMFYDWLKTKTDYVKDYEKLLYIYSLFDLNNKQNKLAVFENIKIMNGQIIKEDVKNIIKVEGFIFPEI